MLSILNIHTEHEETFGGDVHVYFLNLCDTHIHGV